MRLCARGPSGTLTASTPARLQRRDVARASASRPRRAAARSRRDVTNSPRAIFAAQLRALPRTAPARRPSARDRWSGTRPATRRGRRTAVRGRPRSRVRFAEHCRGASGRTPSHHRADVLRRRPAASADDLRARLHEMTRVRRHVLRARHVHAAAADVARHAGVRLRAQLLARRRRRHLLDRLENAPAGRPSN